jgi:PAS domain S-box-containing protein
MDTVITNQQGRELTLSISGAPIKDAEGQVVGGVTLFHDVTEHRRMERELAARAGQMEVTLNAMQDGVTLTDEDGRIVLHNPAFARLVALEREPTLLSHSPQERGARLAFCHPDDRRPLTADEMPATQALQGNVVAGSHALEIHACALDGRELDLSVSAAPIRDRDGGIVGAVTVYRDVTEWREHERERVRMMDLVAHELRHPLAIVQMVDGLVRQDLTLTDREQAAKLCELLDFMDQGVAEMERLVQDLVDAAHLESSHLALDVGPADLAGLVRQVADEQMRLRGNAIQVDVPTRRVMVPVDRMRIAQVLTNLLTNAYKYSPANTPIQVRLRRRRGELCVEVHNEGPAILPEAQAHLFDRFYRVPGTVVLQGPQGGLGLGLYIVRALVEQHGGHIGVQSVAEQGTTFWFTLPLERTQP